MTRFQRGAFSPARAAAASFAALAAYTLATQPTRLGGLSVHGAGIDYARVFVACIVLAGTVTALTPRGRLWRWACTALMMILAINTVFALFGHDPSIAAAAYVGSILLLGLGLRGEA